MDITLESNLASVLFPPDAHECRGDFFLSGNVVQQIKQFPEKMHQGKTMRGGGWVVFLENTQKMHFAPCSRACWF